VVPIFLTGFILLCVRESRHADHNNMWTERDPVEVPGRSSRNKRRQKTNDTRKLVIRLPQILNHIMLYHQATTQAIGEGIL